MKEIIQEPTPEVLTEELKVEILAFINANWDLYSGASEMAKEIENSYIFGPLGENIHIKVDDIIDLIKIVELEKNPIITEEIINE